jgi:hypothetical protein
MNTNRIFTTVALLLITINAFAQNIITVGDSQFKNENGVWFKLDGNQAYQVIENRLTIKYYPGVSEQKKTDFAESIDLSLFYHDTNVDYYVYLIPDHEDIIDILTDLQSHELIKIAEAQTYGYYLSTFCTNPSVPNDPIYFGDGNQYPPLPAQWYLPVIGADCAWQIESGRNTISVALIDSGVDFEHPDIGYGVDSYQSLTEGWNFTYNIGNTMDLCPNGNCHGTKMAGIIAAKTNNNVGIAGVAGGWGNEGVKIMPFVNVDITTGYADPQFTIWSIDSAIAKGAKIINMSFGSTGASYMDDVLEWAYEQGVLMIASAGQPIDGGMHSDSVKYPARHPAVIAVGATTAWDEIAPGSGDGENLELVAPGHNITTTDLGSYTRIPSTTTSVAAAVVSGVAALIWSYNPCFSNEDIRQILRNSADKIDFEFGGYGWDPNNPGHSKKYGYGRVNAYQALLDVNELYPDYYVSEDETWSTDRIHGNIIIDHEATLTLNSIELGMLQGKKIIIEQGSKLIVNGGIITSPCDVTWQGIEVWGNKNEHQWPQSTGYYAQGYLELNDAIIENAINAVSMWKPGDEQTTGGIVIANNTKFINNRRSVHAINYENYDPITERKMNNRASFTRCTFEIEENYPGVEKFSKHIDLDRVDGVRFTACDFLLSPAATNVSAENMAIGSYSAGFTVKALCADTYIPCQTYDHSTFAGFHWAINANNTLGSTRTFFVNQALFNGNAYGIYTSGINNFTVLNSVFNIGYNEPESDPCDGEGKSASGFGIHMTGCTGFAIEENYFTKASGAPQGNYTGILCKDSETQHDIIYRNIFNGLSYGNFAEGNNRYGSDDQFGLEYQCNINSGNNRDFIVTGDEEPRIRGYQGSMSKEAGNTFSTVVQLPDGHFKNTGTQVINYCYNTNPPVYYTPYYVMPIPNAGANTCPSNYGGGSGGSTKDVVLTEDEKQESELAYANNLSDFNNVKALFDNLEDGGNTQALKNEVETAWPSDMWALRAELLGKSPHLSQEVLLAAADKTEVLPESILFEILSANPDELRKEELISHLENKDQPLPAYMISILRQLAGGVTYKTILQQDMARYHAGKTQAAYMLIRSCLNDTVSDNAYLRTWLNNLDNLNADMQIVAAYLAEGNYTAAQAMLNLIPATRNLEGNALAGYNDYKTMMEMQMAWQQQNRSIFELDSLEIAILVDFAENASGKAALMARGILEYAYGYHFCNCLPVDDPAAWKSTAAMPGSDVDNGLSIQAVPNPASTWVAFNFTLPVHVNEAVLQITDVHGKSITSFVINTKQGQQVWDIRDVKKGVYLYTLKAGAMSKNGKLIIQ